MNVRETTKIISVESQQVADFVNAHEGCKSGVVYLHS